MIKSAYIEWHEARMRDLEVAAKLSLERARHGDWLCLAEYIYAGCKTNIEIDNFIVDVLTQKIKRPQNRVARPINDFKSVVYNFGVESAMKTEKNKDAAITTVAEKFGVSRRTIQRAIEPGRVKTAMQTQARLYDRPAAGTPRYLISDAARTAHCLP
jgi:hypothetical protein